MPIITTYQQANFELLVWEITEALDFWKQELQLSPKQLSILQQKYSNPQALQQWLASRCGLQVLFKTSHLNFTKDQLGKLKILDHPYYPSLSHSGSYIAAAKSLHSIGIDLQIPSPKLERIAAKYIATETLTRLEKSPNYIDYLHLYWGIKEALFKAYGLGKVNYIQHLHIQPFEFNKKGYTTATIAKPNFEANYQVFYEKTANYYLCVVTKS